MAETIGGHRVLGPLGQGGMGVVLLVEDPRSGARRALKLLAPGAGPDERLRFAREAQAMARVDDHPHVLRIHAAGEDAGRPFFVMDLATGGDLAARLKAGPLPAREVVRLGRALASGLAHVHARGVLHRDLKPANVLFDERDAPKLVDFGLARVAGAERLTETGTILGTLAYMAPEQADGRRDIDARADVYGLAALLYHALTGQPPFRRGSPLATLNAVLKDPPAPPRQLAPDAPPALEAALLRGLAKEPTERFATVEALAEALEGPPPPRSRAPLIAAVVGTLTLALVSALAWPRPEATTSPPPSTTTTTTTREVPPTATPAAPSREERAFERTRSAVLTGALTVGGELAATGAAVDRLTEAAKASPELTLRAQGTLWARRLVLLALLGTLPKNSAMMNEWHARLRGLVVLAPGTPFALGLELLARDPADIDDRDYLWERCSMPAIVARAEAGGADDLAALHGLLWMCAVPLSRGVRWEDAETRWSLARPLVERLTLRDEEGRPLTTGHGRFVTLARERRSHLAVAHACAATEGAERARRLDLALEATTGLPEAVALIHRARVELLRGELDAADTALASMTVEGTAEDLRAALRVEVALRRRDAAEATRRMEGLVRALGPAATKPFVVGCQWAMIFALEGERTKARASLELLRAEGHELDGCLPWRTVECTLPELAD